MSYTDTRTVPEDLPCNLSTVGLCAGRGSCGMHLVGLAFAGTRCFVGQKRFLLTSCCFPKGSVINCQKSSTACTQKRRSSSSTGMVTAGKVEMEVPVILHNCDLLCISSLTSCCCCRLLQGTSSKAYRSLNRRCRTANSLLLTAK